MVRYLLFAFLLILHSALAKKNGGIKPPPNEPLPPAVKWPTLAGEKPTVIARGGFSGGFPENSQTANDFALNQQLKSDYLYFDLQLTKDGTGICHRDITLEQTSSIAEVFPKGNKTYDVNGIPVSGWFAVDFNIRDLEKESVSLRQDVLTRTDLYDGLFYIPTVEEIRSYAPKWMNVPYAAFYKQRNHDVVAYVIESLRSDIFSYISSPEIDFLKSIGSKIRKDRTKLVFQVLNGSTTEPVSKKEYSTILKDLASIKTFASGILVPKEYVWPVNADGYLEPHTSLVADAHKIGLEVHVSGFANDMPASFNYSYDPIFEYLQFVDQPDFAVDGVLTDFPTTALEALNCFARNNKTKPAKGKPLIISHYGASGVYPPSSDLAYQQAVEDGADVIDCSVQMSKDGVAFCLPSIDIRSNTTAATTFMSRSASVPEIQPGVGIFSFDLTATEIQSLKLILGTPPETSLPRNPENKNKGKIVTLSEFLDIAKAKAVSGVLINIENANYLASKKSLDVTNAVNKALANATFDKQTTQQVFIQSDDTSVLSTFRNVSSYKKILLTKEAIGDVPKESLDEIKKYADAVNVRRPSVIGYNKVFITTTATKLVEEIQSANISIYVSVFRNEFNTIPFDMFSDPYMELDSYASLNIDGLVTDYPATASAYKRSKQTNKECILASPPGGMIKDLNGSVAMPPDDPPTPALKPADIVDPPLPPVIETVTKSPADVAAASSPTNAPPKSGQPTNAANLGLCLVLMVILSCLSLGYYN